MNMFTSSVLAVIPARGGSKGLPGKNLRRLRDKPLINWTIEAALEATCVTRTIVSTDDDEIAQVARDAGAEVPFMRPKEYATDTSTTVDVVAHAISECPGYDIVLVLQPTSPLRTSADIDAAFSAMCVAGASSCISVREVNDSPWLMFRRDSSGTLERLLECPKGGLRRQDLPTVFAVNGAIYFVSTEAFLRTHQLFLPDTFGFVMPAERSFDIDTLSDFEQVERLLLCEN